MTGGRVAHPLLISPANLLMGFRMKGSNRAFFLLTLLPVPKFVHKDRAIRGVLESRMIRVPGLHSEAAQKGSRSWYHDVRSGRFASPRFHPSRCIHG